jgi:Uma2 family endonuclease
MMAPLANDEHQEIQTKLVAIFQGIVGWSDMGVVRAGVNVSDRNAGWQHNYRCPDVAVFLQGTSARNCGTHWMGGSDFAVEILSPNDRAREKLGFYAQVGVRELLMIDRDPWSVELYRLDAGPQSLVADAKGGVRTSAVLPVTFELEGAGAGRPVIVVRQNQTANRWAI